MSGLKLALLSLVFAGFAYPASGTWSARPERRPAVQVLQSNEHGVTIAISFERPGSGAQGSEASAGSGRVVASPVDMEATWVHLQALSSGFVSVDVPGCAHYLESGEPDLPQLRFMVGVSQQGEVKLASSLGPATEMSGVDVAPVPSDVNDTPALAPGPAYERDAFYPEAPVRVEGIELLRQVRVARLLVSPVQYDPKQHRLRAFGRLTVSLSFAVPAVPDAGDRTAGRDPFESLYPEMLVNGAQAGQWKAGPGPGIRALGPSPGPVPLSATSSFFNRSRYWVKIEIESTGVYQVGWDDLSRCGVNTQFIDPRTFQLFTVGEHRPDSECADTMREVSLYVAGEADSSFDRKDYLLFYGRSVSEWDPGLTTFTTNLYTRNNVYWLTWGANPGQRIPIRAGAPQAGTPLRKSGRAKIRIEQDQDCPARAGLLWIWQELAKRAGTPSLSAEFDLPLQYPLAITQFKGRFFSTSVGPNHMSLYLNQRLLDTAVYSQRSANSPFDVTVGSNSFPCPGVDSLANTLTVELAGDTEMQCYVDYFEVSYKSRLRMAPGRELSFFVAESTPQTFSIERVPKELLVLRYRDPCAPEMITGALRSGDSCVFRDLVADTAAYVVADLARLRRPRSIVRRSPGRVRINNQFANYVIITPDEFYDAVQDLARYRSHRLPMVDAPVVRTARLSEIYDDFSFGRQEPIAIRQFLRAVRPAYCLLLGDATYDYRDCLGLHPEPGVPPVEIGVDLEPPGEHSTAAKAMDGWYADLDGDGSTPDMFLGRVTVRSPDGCAQFVRKLINYENTSGGFWCKRAVLLADDEWKGGVGVPDELGSTHIDDCENIAALLGHRLEPVKVYLTEYPFAAFGDKPTARAALLNELQRGALLFCYFGHGSGEALTSEGAFNVQAVSQMTNQGRSPLCYFGSCSVGRWEDTRSECIAEEVARLPDGGGIAGIGATQSTTPSQNLSFAQRLCSSLLDCADSGIGRAFVAGVPYGTSYHLFGDPATRLHLPDTSSNIVDAPDTLHPGRVAEFSGSAPVASGFVEATLFGPRQFRTYLTSSRFVEGGKITYTLPGNELGRAMSRVGQGRYQGGCVVPSRIDRGVRHVADGTYEEIDGTSRLSLVAWDRNRVVGLLHDAIGLDTQAASTTDRTGPVIALFADGEPLTPAGVCPVGSNFTLTGRLSDSAGILICPVASDDAFYVYLSDFRNRIQLADRFQPDLDSHVSGSFSYPITLATARETLVVVSSDNLLNRSRFGVLLENAGDNRLSIAQPLIYPNPVSGESHFTFFLSAPAAVTVRVFSLSGRPLRTIGPVPARSGYNQVSWNGRDRESTPLPNGVYLYTVTAHSADGQTGEEQAVTVREKLIVRR